MKNTMKDRLYIATFSEDAINMASQYGVGLELNHICISENLDPDKIEKTRREIARDIELAGGKKPILHGPFTELCPGSIDHRIVEVAMERFNEVYFVAREFNIKKMVVHSGYIPLLYYKEWHKEKSIELWRSFMADKPADFCLCIENVFEDEPYMLKELIEELDDPRIGICLDIGHANVMKGKNELALGNATCGGGGLPQKALDIPGWIEVLGEHIRHFHIHNNNGERDLHDSLECGMMNTQEIFKTIEEYCHGDTTFTIESRTCKNTLKWMRDKQYI